MDDKSQQAVNYWFTSMINLSILLIGQVQGYYTEISTDIDNNTTYLWVSRISGQIKSYSKSVMYWDKIWHMI